MIDFISENAIMVAFKRRTKVETPEGGFQWSSTVTTLPPQKARLVQSGRIAAAADRNIPDGRIVNIEATLVMAVGADVQLYDLVDIPAHGVGGDPALEGQWEVGQISGRWALNAGIFRHAS